MPVKKMRVTSPAPRDAWQEMANADPNAFVFQTPRGLDCIAEVENCSDASRLYEFPDGLRLVLPMMRRRGLPSRLGMECSPVFGGFVASRTVNAEALQAVFADLASRPVLQTVVSSSALGGEVWTAAAPKDTLVLPRTAHVLDLDGGFDTVWKERFNSHARRGVRKAEKQSLELEVDKEGKLIEPFYELLLCSVNRWAGKSREPAALARWRLRRRDPIRRFYRMAEILGDAFRIWGARVDGQLAAAIMVLKGPNAHYVRGAMDIDLAGPTRASIWLQKLAIEDACNTGCRYFHMGQTGSESLARFKSQFGATAYTYPEFYIERLPLAATKIRLRSIVKTAINSRRGS